MLERAFSVHNQSEREKDRSQRKPYSATTGIKLLIDEECTGVSTALMNVARINVLRHFRLPGQHMYEWSTSFETIHRALKLAGYAWKEGDDEELYKTILISSTVED